MLAQLSQSAPVSSRTPLSHRTSEHDGRRTSPRRVIHPYGRAIRASPPVSSSRDVSRAASTGGACADHSST